MPTATPVTGLILKRSSNKANWVSPRVSDERPLRRYADDREHEPLREHLKDRTLQRGY
jgi:hypothetical protein